MTSTVTVLDLAKEVFRQNKWLQPEGGVWSMGDFNKAGLPMMGGCEVCEASIAAYNAYPSKGGYLRCADCIGEDGWHSSTKAFHDIFPDGDEEDTVKPSGPTMVRVVWSNGESSRFYASSWGDVTNVLKEFEDKANVRELHWPDED
jgi:hypothetical protein